MSQEPANDDVKLREELVAYLDGELSADESRQIERRLAEEPDTRRAMQELDRTWNLLDELETPAVDDGFTRTTMEMVALAAGKDAEQAKAEAPRRRRRRTLWTAAALAAAALAGFLAVALLTPDPNAELLRDLPLLENLDQYHQVDGIEFLELLVREKLFAEDIDEVSPPAPTRTDDSPAARRQRVRDMSDAQKEELFRHREQLRALGTGEQHRIALLHEQLQTDRQGEQLRETMNHYCRWLATLSPYRRANLLDMKPQDRLKAIKQTLQEHARSESKRLDAKDRDVLVQWLDQYAKDHESQFYELLPENRRRQTAKMTPAMRHRIAFVMVCQRWQSGDAAVHPPATEQEMAALRSRLSADTRSRLESKPVAEQPRVLTNWLQQAARQEVLARRGEGGVLFGFDEQLADFFEYQLSDEERDRLMSLPGDEMQQRLHELFLMKGKGVEPGGRAKPGDHRGDRPWHGHRGVPPLMKPHKDGRDSRPPVDEPAGKALPEKTSGEKSPPDKPAGGK